MTRFVYVADTHLGACPMGYHQQPAYPERLHEILIALDAWIRDAGDVDFVLHGGDMADAGREELIRNAALRFRLTIPVYLCLGNHDLTEQDSADAWLRVAPHFFRGGSPQYTVRTDDCAVQVVPNHWDAIPFYWGERQDAHFSADQTATLREALHSSRDVPNVLLTHSPVYGLPPAQTGLEEPLHSPGQAFAECVSGLAAAHPAIRCVLGAHNHMNMHVEHDDVHYATVSSLVEAPFEFKVFNIDRSTVCMETVSLADRVGFAAEYDDSKRFVQGRREDREFRAPGSACVPANRR